MSFCPPPSLLPGTHWLTRDAPSLRPSRSQAAMPPSPRPSSLPCTPQPMPASTVRDCGPFQPGPHQAAPPCLHSAPACANVFDVTGVLGVGRRAQRGEQPNATVTTTATVSMAAAFSVAVGSSGAGGSLSLERGVFSLCQGWRRFNREWRWRHRQRCGEHTLTWSTQCTCTKFTCTNLVHTLCNLHVHV